MSKAIVGIAKSAPQVERTLLDLQNTAAIPAANISVLMPDSGSTPELGAVKASKAPEGATTGAVAGGAIGGTLGLLAGIGTLAIPGLGALVAAGPIMAALSGVAAGATAGGVVGALVGLGIPEYEAKTYETHIKNGGYLIAVHTPSHESAHSVRDIFKANKLEDISAVSEEK
ncbi:hypothetical protein TSACC_22469 [Terrimicrobium sacchariphilum]|uniref:DUF3341 domain-containing protein n=1 Tax=Terrimicrobium sacchariphilum TaxID=690879 RepID=A0A146GBX9_TERSA|nr:hypothetical protein [Terrimicrobium sacchariphilum]GAT34046.1 hypothetical protein TSACC_22469 [Terrimicrobium sacchariphilum]